MIMTYDRIKRNVGRRFQSLTYSKVTYSVVVLWILAYFGRNWHDYYSSEVLYSRFLNSIDHELNGTTGEAIKTLQAKPLILRAEIFSIKEEIQVKEKWENCGLSKSCPDGFFSVYLDTGFENKRQPKLCVDDKVIIDKDTNNVGRGINVAIIDNMTKTIVKVANYDTYGEESTDLETTILTLRKGEIIIFLTYDEPSNKLSTVSKLLLHELGSSMAQNLQFRTSWYLITYKGINGYSPFEEMNFPDSFGWGKTHTLHRCIPIQFKGDFVKPDKTVVTNPIRVKFCGQYSNDWPLFCPNSLVNEPLMTSKILHPLPISVEIIATPIVVLVKHCSSEYLPFLFETILRQPEMNARNVIVYHLNCGHSLAELARIFGFRTREILSDENRQNLTQLVHQDYQRSKQMMIIEDEVVLSPDFFPFMGQLMLILHYKNSNIFAISAFNENAYDNCSVDCSTVYRVDGRIYKPLFAFMVKISDVSVIYEPKSGLVTIEGIRGDILMPEMSRAFVFSSPVRVDFETGAGVEPVQAVCLQSETLINFSDYLSTSERYDQLIVSMFTESKKFTNVENFLKYQRETDFSRRENDVISFVCVNNENCLEFCDYFSIQTCLFHKKIDSIGSILRFALGPNKTKAFIIHQKDEFG